VNRNLPGQLDQLSGEGVIIPKGNIILIIGAGSDVIRIKQIKDRSVIELEETGGRDLFSGHLGSVMSYE